MSTAEFIRFCEEFRPGLRTEKPFEIFASVFGLWTLANSIADKKREGHVMKSTMCDALAELIPEQREFWLRAEATLDLRFVEGMTALMTGPEAQEQEPKQD